MDSFFAAARLDIDRSTLAGSERRNTSPDVRHLAMLEAVLRHMPASVDRRRVRRVERALAAVFPDPITPRLAPAEARQVCAEFAGDLEAVSSRWFGGGAVFNDDFSMYEDGVEVPAPTLENYAQALATMALLLGEGQGKGRPGPGKS